MRYLSVLLPYAVLSFLLNFFWESWHGIYFYATASEYSGRIVKYLHINTVASLQDAFSLLVIFVVVASVGGLFWWRQLSLREVGLFAVLSIGGAYAVEFYATEVVNWWSYNEVMPMIGHAGLSPLVQIFVTGMLAIALMNLLLRSGVRKQTERTR